MTAGRSAGTEQDRFEMGCKGAHWWGRWRPVNDLWGRSCTVGTCTASQVLAGQLKPR